MAAEQQPRSSYGVEVLGRHVTVLFLDEVTNLDRPYKGQIREVRVLLDDKNHPVTKHWIVFDDGDDYWFDDLAALEREGRCQWRSVDNNDSDNDTKRRADNFPYGDESDMNHNTAYKKQRTSPEESNVREEQEEDIRPESVSSRHRVTPDQHQPATFDNNYDTNSHDAHYQPEAVASAPPKYTENAAAAAAAAAVNTPATNIQQPPYCNPWNYAGGPPVQAPKIYPHRPQPPAYYNPHVRYNPAHNRHNNVYHWNNNTARNRHNNVYHWNNNTARPYWGGGRQHFHHNNNYHGGPPRIMPHTTNYRAPAMNMNMPDQRNYYPPNHNYYHRLNNFNGGGYPNAPATQTATTFSPQQIDNTPKYHGAAYTPAATSHRPPWQTETSDIATTNNCGQPSQADFHDQDNISFHNNDESMVVTKQNDSTKKFTDGDKVVEYNEANDETLLEEGKALIGKRVRKEFPQAGFFAGTVTDYDQGNKYYMVEYEDGDQEEYSLHEIRKHMECYEKSRLKRDP